MDARQVAQAKYKKIAGVNSTVTETFTETQPFLTTFPPISQRLGWRRG
jgi:hypothetical protein